MTEEKQKYFNAMNKAWDTLGPHVKEPSNYKKIMSELFNMFFRDIPNKFSDAWWKTTIDMFLDYAKGYYGNPLENFAGELVMGLLNYREHESKLNINSYDMFYKDIEGAFLNERNRIKRSQ